jgi:hypothetical protein
MRLISPILEKRIRESHFTSHSGELLINFYRDGIKLAFNKGVITSIDSWQPQTMESGMISFPDQTFLKLLLGYRSFEDLEYAFPDCYIVDDKQDVRELINVLFPPRPSYIWGIT